jgi:hypothetical protein
MNERVLSIDGIILTRLNPSTRRKTCHSAFLKMKGNEEKTKKWSRRG